MALTPTQARDRAIQLANVDQQAAYDTAIEIRDPWYGCQALAWVARFADERRFDSIIDEAFKVGRSADDAYRHVGSAAWPLRALVERNRVKETRRVLQDLLTLVPQIRPASSRSEALFLLFQAVFPAGRNLWESIIQLMAIEPAADSHWRQHRNLRDAILIVASENTEFACELSRRMPPGRQQRQLDRLLAEADFRQPRDFFVR